MSRHVLYVSDVYFPRVNGVSTSIGTFREDLGAIGVTTTLVAPDYGNVPGAVAGRDSEGVIRIPSRRVPRDPEDRLMNRRALQAALLEAPAQPYDLVHIHTPFLAHYAAIRAARHWRIPVVATCHTYFEDYLHHYLPVLPHAAGRWLARRFTTSQFRHVDAVIAPSEPLRDKLREYGVQAQIEVVPTGIPASRFVPGDGARFRRRHDIPAGRRIVLIVGRVAHEKNLGFLLRMFAQLSPSQPKALLVVAGEGPAREALASQAATLGLTDNIRFVGNLDREQGLNDCYAAASVFVFASRTETQGLVLLEAMAQGCAVVSTACLGTRSVLGEGCGALVVPEDLSLFADAVGKVLNDPLLAAAASTQGRAWAEGWSSRGLAGRVAELYAEVCKRAVRRSWQPESAAAVTESR
ncbi:MAG TPA: glycosyltransferase [Steroidobacteraceae bacterium]|nr:glycosyltransferase [Steroidobacteraceae bacterium]